MFIKHGSPEPIRQIIDVPSVIEEMAQEAIKKAQENVETNKQNLDADKGSK